MDLISQSGRDQQNVTRSAKVDAIGQVNGTVAGRGAGAVVIMKRERAHTRGRTWTQMPNLDAKVELEILTWDWKSRRGPGNPEVSLEILTWTCKS